MWRVALLALRRHLDSDAEGFGFLLGRRERTLRPGVVRVVLEAAWPAPGREPFDGDSPRFEHAWSAAVEEARHRRLEVLGWYRRHPDPGLALPQGDQAIQSRFFPQPYQLAVGYAPTAGEDPARGAIFGRTTDGGPDFRPVPFDEVVESGREVPASVVDWSNYRSDRPVADCDALDAGEEPDSPAAPVRPQSIPHRRPPRTAPQSSGGGMYPSIHAPERRKPPRASGPPRGAGTPPDTRAFLDVLRTHRALVAATVAVVVAAVGVGTLLQDPVYRAEGMLELRQQAAEIVSGDAAQAGRVSEQHLQTQYEILHSPALARRVVLDVGLWKDGADTPPATGPERAEAVERATSQLRGGLVVDPVTGSQLVRVSFESHDPRLAATVVNSLFTHYIALRTEVGRASASRLRQQLDSVRASLTASEARLQDYARANSLLPVGTGGDGVGDVANQRLRDLQAQLTAAEADRYQKEAAFTLLQRQGNQYLESQVLQSLSVQVATLRSEYARLRSTFSDAYPRAREARSQLTAMEAQLARERTRVAAQIRTDYLAAVQRQDLLRAAFERQREVLDGLSSRMAQYRILQRDVEGHKQLYDILQQRQKATDAAAALAAAEVGIVDRAMVPRAPVSPSPVRNLQLAVLVGLMLGVGLAFFREWTRSAVRTAEELGSLSRAPVLAAIPSVRSLESRQGRWLPRVGVQTFSGEPEPENGWYRIDHVGEDSPDLADAFGSLRTSVLYDFAGSGARTLLVTSAQPRDGKTTVSMNLGISLTKLGRRVLLVDADLRRPSLHRAFALPAEGGLADVLEGRAGWQSLVHRGGSEGLDVLPAGTCLAGAAELLSTPAMRRLLEDAMEEYDFVVVDAPAMLINAADARILASLVDGVVLVARSGATPREMLARALRVVPNVVGVILNDVDIRHFPPYYRDDGPGPQKRLAGRSASG